MLYWLGGQTDKDGVFSFVGKQTENAPPADVIDGNPNQCLASGATLKLMSCSMKMPYACKRC